MALNCATISNGIAKPCGYSAGGGIQDVWFINTSQRTGDLTRATNGLITNIPLGSDNQLHKYEFAKNTGNFTQALQGGDTGDKSILQSLTFSLSGAIYNQDTKNELSSFGLAELEAVVKMNNKYYYVGDKSGGLEATTLEQNSGTAQADQSLINIVISATSQDFADEIDSTYFKALLNSSAGTAGGNL